MSDRRGLADVAIRLRRENPTGTWESILARWRRDNEPASRRLDERCTCGYRRIVVDIAGTGSVAVTTIEGGDQCLT